MNHVLQSDELPWKPFEAPTLRGYALKPGVIGPEYTDAYSADLVRVEPGGYSASHIDQARHAFYILQGEGVVVIGEKTWQVRSGSVVKIPPGIAHEVRNEGAAQLVFLTLYDPPRIRK